MYFVSLSTKQMVVSHANSIKKIDHQIDTTTVCVTLNVERNNLPAIHRETWRVDDLAFLWLCYTKDQVFPGSDAKMVNFSANFP